MRFAAGRTWRSRCGPDCLGGLPGDHVHGIRSGASGGCFRFPDPEPTRYLQFLGVFFLRSLQLHWPSPVASWFGLPLAILCVTLTVWSGWRTLVDFGRPTLHVIVACLSGFTLVFALTSAVGRACLGPGGATASRYVPYLLPFLIAVYLALSVPRPVPWTRRALLSLFFVAVVVNEASVGPDLAWAAARARQKALFVDCYLATGNATLCNIHAPVHPDPAATRLEEKVRFFRERRLGFLAP